MPSKSPSKVEQADDFNVFTHWFAKLSGLLGATAAGCGVLLGLTGDAVLGESAVQLWLVAGITLVAVAVLLVPRKSALTHSLGLGACALAFHIILSRSWLPWIEHYQVHAALGTGDLAWEEALALPLLMVAGVLLVASALFAWPAGRSVIDRSTDVQHEARHR